MALEIQYERTTAEHVVSLEEQLKMTSEEVQSVAKSQKKTEESLRTLEESVRTLVGWSGKFDKSLEEILTSVVCEYTDGERTEKLKDFNDATGRSIVEFDGAVEGEIDGDPVLVLIESKHHVKQVDVDLASCTTTKEKHDCLPTRAERYTDAYNGSVEAWENAAVGKLKRHLGQQSSIIKRLREQNTKLVFAVGGRYFPQSLQTYCKKEGYLCIVPNGDGFEIMK